MLTNILTVEDLEAFKQSLFVEMKKMISEMNGLPDRKWLKTPEVRKLLKLSQGSLQNLRENGQLPFTKLGGMFYYSLDDINTMLENSRVVGPRSPFSLEKRSKQKGQSGK